MSPVSVSPVGTFSDPVIKPLIDGFRHLVAQRYTPCGPTDLSRMLSSPPYHVSRKIDGELWFLHHKDDGVELVAANGRVAHGDLPPLAHSALPAGTVVAGELYVAGQDGARERVGDVSAALSNNPEALRFGVFDLVRHETREWQEMAYAGRVEILQGLLESEGPLHFIGTTDASSELDVAGLYEDLVEGSRAEGLVVRCGDGRVLKVKPEITLDFGVIGFTSRQGPKGEELRSLLLALHLSEDTWVAMGTVGNVIEGIDRTELLAALTQIEVSGSYRRAASGGQLYRLTKPEVVVECRVLDIQQWDSKELPVRQVEVTFTDGAWKPSGQIAAGGVINPVVQRIREDKANPRDGARFAQLAPYLIVSSEKRPPVGEPEVIRRQVWTKVTGDRTDVRKLVVWKTNREESDSSYPPFVVHWTDYSSARKSPLAREVRPSASKKMAESLADAMVEGNIKKGWNETVAEGGS